MKVVRCNLPVAFRSGEWASADGVVPAEVIQRELTNMGNFTSRLAFDTIWTKSIKLRGIKGGNQKIPTIRLKKFIKCQYLRSTIRRVSTAGDQATLGSQALPNTYESQDGYFNNLALEAFDQVIKRFPESKYAKDSRQKIILVNSNIAAKHMEIGRFYLNNKKYIAALNRFKIVINEFFDRFV